MKSYGVGLAVVIAFSLLLFAIVSSACISYESLEGFLGVPPKDSLTSASKEAAEKAGEKAGAVPLPSAPINDLAQTNSRPYQDPAEEKTGLQMLSELKVNIDGFMKEEYPFLVERSDPAIKLPLTRLSGDYQRIKDEIKVLEANPGLQPQITMAEIDTMGANLRFLQRTYRKFANVKMTEGQGVEGFADDSPITALELKLLSAKLAIEIARLQASGTTDPVLEARVSVFTKIQQTVNGLLTQLGNGTLDAKNIPIKESDYQNFLPALGDSSSEIGDLTSGYDSIDRGVLISNLAAQFDPYIAKGVSISVSYVSDNDVAKQQAMAHIGPRGEFDSITRQLSSKDGFLSRTENGYDSRFSNYDDPNQPGKFDWKGRAEQITDNIKKAGMDPSDFGCLPPGAHVSSDYGWRGHTKMVCSRLATNADPAIPEQMGCPPVSWRGWRM